VRNGDAAIALGRNDRFDTRGGKLRADGICVVAFVGEQRFDAVAEHPEQRAKALHIVRLPRCQDEAERPSVSIAARVEFCGEAAARPAKALLSEVEGPLGLLIPFFRPTAQ